MLTLCDKWTWSIVDALTLVAKLTVGFRLQAYLGATIIDYGNHVFLVL